MTVASSPQVAVVGAGPSGFYAAEALLKKGVAVALIERLPAPFGLVRYGVAPDHQKLKSTIAVYERIAQTPGLAFFGNVHVGRDIAVDPLRELFDAVVFAHGAHGDRALGIPGEALAGCHGASDFVGWYNGHPDCRDFAFDLRQQAAVIVGNGNVALDVARLLAKRPEALASSDIARHAQDALAASRIRDIHVVGRRGPSQAKFSSTELRELALLEDCSIHYDPRDLEEPAPPGSTTAWLASLPPPAAHARRRIHFHFFLQPAAVEGARGMETMVFERTRPSAGAPGAVEPTGETVRIAAGLLVKAVGYRGTSLPGLPFDAARGIVPTRDDRVLGADGQPLAGLYATGWVKRGPSGVIGSNRADSVGVVARVLEDLAAAPAQQRGGIEALRARLQACRVIDFADWQRIDRAEVAAGQAVAKPREKFTRVPELMAAAGWA